MLRRSFIVIVTRSVMAWPIIAKWSNVSNNMITPLFLFHQKLSINTVYGYLWNSWWRTSSPKELNITKQLSLWSNLLKPTDLTIKSRCLIRNHWRRTLMNWYLYASQEVNSMSPKCYLMLLISNSHTFSTWFLNENM